MSRARVHTHTRLRPSTALQSFAHAPEYAKDEQAGWGAHDGSIVHADRSCRRMHCGTSTRSPASPTQSSSRAVLSAWRCQSKRNSPPLPPPPTPPCAQPPHPRSAALPHPLQPSIPPAHARTDAHTAPHMQTAPSCAIHALTRARAGAVMRRRATGHPHACTHALLRRLGISFIGEREAGRFGAVRTALARHGSARIAAITAVATRRPRLQPAVTAPRGSRCNRPVLPVAGLPRAEDDYIAL